MELTKTNFLGKTNTMQLNISEEEFEECSKKHQSGMAVQDAFPMLNADEREFILTGLTPEEWDNLFK